MSLTRKMLRRAGQARWKRGTRVRKLIDHLKPSQRQRVREWCAANPGREVTPAMVEAIAMGLAV